MNVVDRSWLIGCSFSRPSDRAILGGNATAIRVREWIPDVADGFRWCWAITNSTIGMVYFNTEEFVSINGTNLTGYRCYEASPQRTDSGFTSNPEVAATRGDDEAETEG